MTDHDARVLAGQIVDNWSHGWYNSLEGNAREELVGTIATALYVAHRAGLATRIETLEYALRTIAECPPEAVHLMPLAAQAALSEEHKANG
jgi:hypothetical protein